MYSQRPSSLYTILYNERVATSWNAQNAILAMLGAGDKIVSTTDLVKTIPFFTVIVPAIKTASISSKGNNDTLNIETLIVSQPQIFLQQESYLMHK
ncbi:hypothetical protein L2V81_09085 [Proteus terrae]|nr:hypothetical protein [Proteus terrae]